MKKPIFKGMLELLFAGLPAILALDLLYLYFAGSWYDPIRWVELTEVVLLVIVSIIYLSVFILKAWGHYHSTDARQ